MSILVLTTGGTIGAAAYPDPQNPPALSEPLSPETDLVRRALVSKEFSFANTRCMTLEHRDSKLIDVSYLAEVLALVAGADEQKILITHGTDRMLQTADYFYQNLSRLGGKTIMLTGAMTPLANGDQSDGYRNLEYALKQLLWAQQDDTENNGAVFIVLCDYADPHHEKGPWQPTLYHYKPGHFTKHYAADGRYNRLKRVQIE